jgi:glycosyltransferase involved in cell wall biosynthesis
MDAERTVLLISGAGYPSPTDPYPGAFIHTRVKAYAEHGIRCHVFVPSKRRSPEQYSFEGVPVTVGGQAACGELIARLRPAKILVHFLSSFAVRVLRAAGPIPAVVWVHGFEVLGWYRRLFNFSPKFLMNIPRNIARRINVHRFLESPRGRTVHFVFVSHWLKQAAEHDLRCKFQHHSIIPNPIDETFFRFEEKPADLRKRILLLRPFVSRTYAGDLAIRAIRSTLNTTPGKDLKVSIIGKGRLFKRLTRRLQGAANVQLHNGWLKREEMVRTFQEHGIILTPARQDTQGVTMCEAMMSGLVPVALNRTATPEFVTHGHSGFLAETVQQLSSYLLRIAGDEKLFQACSRRAHQEILQKASFRTVLHRELELIRS